MNTEDDGASPASERGWELAVDAGICPRITGHISKWPAMNLAGRFGCLCCSSLRSGVWCVLVDCLLELLPKSEFLLLDFGFVICDILGAGVSFHCWTSTCSHGTRASRSCSVMGTQSSPL